MATPTITDTLLDKVRLADGESREVDEAVSIWRDGNFCVSVRPYSSSLDACLNLMNDVLPGSFFDVGEAEMGANAIILVPRQDRGDYSGARKYAYEGARTPALALLDCILQALLSNQEAIKEKTDEGR